MKTQNPPIEARAAAEAVCGPGMTLTLISNRRGSAVWQAAGEWRSVAVKVGTGPEGAVITARETAALYAGLAGRGALLGHGRLDGVAWMVTPWREGASTWEALSDVRCSDGDHSLAKNHMIDVCEAVARLHAAGWVHSDLQPQHTIHTTDGVRFIDCSWAWHPRLLRPSNMFMGGLPHLLAPELAESIHEGDRPVAPSPSAEVYTLAAGLWWAITGDWPLDYAALDIDPRELTAAELRHQIATCKIPLRGPWMWHSVQDILSRALIEPPERRPTAAELASSLRSS
ncbi:hypothetical protein ACQEVY_23615 [Streptomyces sp. CA-288835]|uniref:hypothetical protein n=1 Tax=Streptomyces sp. CA-288835 TaxID=3240069 RepID=UPI003D8BDEDE